MHAGPWGDAGTVFAIDVGDGDRPSTIKRKLAGLTGIPVEHQKLMLGAFCQVRRTSTDDDARPITHSACCVVARSF